MIRIVRGDLRLGAALEQERLDVVAPGRKRRWLSAWLNLSPLSAVRSQRVQDSGRAAGRV
jgi:hypothetical protein